MRRGAAVVGAVDRARARAAVHGLRRRRRAARPTSWPDSSRRWRRSAHRRPYDLGCLYVGVNDVRAARTSTWPPSRRDHAAALGVPGGALRARAARDVPARPRPAAGGRLAEGNAAVERRGPRARRAAAGPPRLRRPQPRDGRPRAPDGVRAGGDRRARARRAGRGRDGRPRRAVGADRAVRPGRPQRVCRATGPTPTGTPRCRREEVRDVRSGLGRAELSQPVGVKR